MVGVMFFSFDVKGPLFYPRATCKFGLVVFDNYSEHVTELFKYFCMFINAHAYFLQPV